MTQKSSQYQKILAAIVSTVNYNTAKQKALPGIPAGHKGGEVKTA